MNEELFFFTIGSLFIYCRGFSSRIWHVVSLYVFYIFAYSLMLRKSEQTENHKVRVIKVNEMLICTVLVFSEYILVKRKTHRVYFFLEKTFVSIMLFGYFLSLYSVFEFCKKQKKEKLFISTGVYQYVRHPFYFGLFLSIIGTSVYLSSYVCASFILVYTFTRIRERILGEEKVYEKYRTYQEYKRKVPSGFFI